jgi:hypothetical protein
MVIIRWMKGARPRPTESGRIRLGWAKPKGLDLKAGVREILLRHEGLAPVRLRKGSKPDWAFKRTQFCRTSDRIALSFPLRPADPRSVDAGFLGSPPEALGRPVGHEGARPSAILKMAPALRLLQEAEDPETKTMGPQTARGEQETPTPPIASARRKHGRRVGRCPMLKANLAGESGQEGFLAPGVGASP